VRVSVCVCLLDMIRYDLTVRIHSCGMCVCGCVWLCVCVCVCKCDVTDSYAWCVRVGIRGRVLACVCVL